MQRVAVHDRFNSLLLKKPHYVFINESLRNFGKHFCVILGPIFISRENERNKIQKLNVGIRMSFNEFVRFKLSNKTLDDASLHF